MLNYEHQIKKYIDFNSLQLPFNINSTLFKMKKLISLTLLAFVALYYFSSDFSKADTSIIAQFENWKVQFNKQYQTQAQELYRLTNFIENLKIINAHNAQTHKNYQVGVNQFSDLTEEQFKEIYLTLIPPLTNSLRYEQNKQQILTQLQADGQINWVQQGFVTNVKNQGQCGSCWAFSALGPLEALLKMQGNPLVSLSAQQLMDCSTDYGNYGCNGGLVDSALKYIKDKGITTEGNYPYKGQFQKCLKQDGQYKIKGFADLRNCKDIASQLMKIPISVGVDATKFHLYQSGVFNCTDKPSLNHASTLVGMTKDYWLTKEQWGTSWGQGGYMKISKTGTACGICQMASYPN